VVETRDISLAGRILANFPDEPDARTAAADDLAELGALAKPRTPTSSSCPTSVRRSRS
jgi:monomeric isocitrate dehydrogenase